MDANDLRKSDDGFIILSQDEQLETCGGFYKGPTPPHMWIQFLLEKLKNGED